MTAVIDLPDTPPSPISRLDSRWKLAALLPAAFLIPLLQTLPPALIAGVGAIVLCAAARFPLRWLLGRLVGVAFFFSFFLAWLPFIPSRGETACHLGWIAVYPAGFYLACLLLVKALALVSIMLILFATAPLQDTCKAAHALRVPGILIHLLLLTYRFVHLAAEEFARLRIALRVRGFRNRACGHSYRTVGQVAGTLLVRSLERAERVGHAMRCRGFDGTFRSLQERRTELMDVLMFTTIIGIAAALWVWDFLRR